uniref:C-X-C motif chemokine n=1 Tax=Acanthochromis polyacanthus TaxID=80966 RepID=A0A3Q1EKJ3_9TELE
MSTFVILCQVYIVLCLVFFILSLICVALSVNRCRCIRTVPGPIPRRVIKRIEVIPPSGRCRRTEILIFRRNGPIVCVDPEAKWFQKFLENLQR